MITYRRDGMLLRVRSPLFSLALILASSLWINCNANQASPDAMVIVDSAPPPPDAPSKCGNRTIEPGEDCDDGNVDDSDGCSIECKSSRTVGCNDGRRDGFVDLGRYPDIAACAGGWTVGGLEKPSAKCLGQGDDGANRSGCAAVDLCAQGWHICKGRLEVKDLTGEAGCKDAIPAGEIAKLFFATLQPSFGGMDCTESDAGAPGTNDLFGCGNLGNGPLATCLPLDRTSFDVCSALGAPWVCPPDPGTTVSAFELTTVVKNQAALGGGVICCRDK